MEALHSFLMVNIKLLGWLPSASISLSFAVLHYWLRWWWPITLSLVFLIFLGISAAVVEYESLVFQKKARPDGKDTCLVTGGAKGIGLSIAKLFARDGYNVMLVARHEEDLVEAKGKLLQINPNISVFLISKDLYKEKGADEVFEEAESIARKENLRLNHIVNNIGLCIRGDFLDLPLLDQLGMMQLNMMNTVKLTHLFGNKFKEAIQQNPSSTEEFRFMVTSSFASVIVCPFLSLYSGTKAFLHAFSLSFNEELKAPKYMGRITCTSLCPGYTITASLPPAGIPNSVAITLKNYDGPDRVGHGGYRAMMQGKPYVLIGFLNNLTYWITCIMPTPVTSKLGKFFNSDWDSLSPSKLVQEGFQAKEGWTQDQPASRDMRAALADQ